MNERAIGTIKAPSKPISMMYRVYRYVLPGVSAELEALRQRALRIPDPELQTQALASLADKRFHCQGGSVYAILDPNNRDLLLPLIVALQTISDYLDNLCDRSTSLDADDFRLLHRSMLDAVDPFAELTNYYALRKEQDDGGYLHHLVRTCQKQVRQLPGYAAAQPEVSRLVSLYGDLQVYKHIHKDLREDKLLDWWEQHKEEYPELRWNEFAAATGSTLGMFALFTAAADPGLTPERASAVRKCYFPYVCSLHILLDYLIDQEEDRVGGDLNFCNYYSDTEEAAQRMGMIVERAREDIRHLPDPGFHRLIVEGLLALYLSDPKVGEQGDVKRVTRSLMKHSTLARLFFRVNSVWIRRIRA
ncbi:tetraprenyl-beta-curcumene synthase family protein [Paenibacillus herberti]|nr:tetraprenyl-beta-curcumene synthase family protein [Paenibacillus herberti]